MNTNKQTNSTLSGSATKQTTVKFVFFFLNLQIWKSIQSFKFLEWQPCVVYFNQQTGAPHQVLRMPFAGQNNLFCVKTSFFPSLTEKKESPTKTCNKRGVYQRITWDVSSPYLCWTYITLKPHLNIVSENCWNLHSLGFKFKEFSIRP